jgi:hypothetical protein
MISGFGKYCVKKELNELQFYFSDRINQSSLTRLRLGMQAGQDIAIRKNNSS